MAAGGQRQRFGRRAVVDAAAGAAQLYDPATGVRRVRGREVQVDLGAVRARGLQRGGQRRRGVDDQQVAGRQEVGEVEEVRVDQRAVRLRDQQPDLVADGRRRRCLQVRGKVEVERRHAGTSSRAW